jgi:hypothetical protein
MTSNNLDVYVCTFNCARNLVKPEVFGPQLLNATSSAPDFLVLCLQEIAPIGYAYLGGSFLTPYFNAFRAAIKHAGESYTNVIARNVGLTGIMIFARKEVAAQIQWMQSAGVGVGVSETGNKGAVGVRIGYGSGERSTQLTFVSAHLAPMEDALERRNEDYCNIARKLIFASDESRPTVDEEHEDTPLLQESRDGSSGGGLYEPDSHLFFAGDLNYRTSLVRPSAEDYQSFPQPTKDTEDAHHYAQLLSKDQLSQQIQKGNTLQGLQEASIDFPPTYKYHPKADIAVDDADEPWNWAAHRWPSWCDRIFYSPTSIKINSYNALPLFGTSDHRPVALFASIPVRQVNNAYENTTVPYSVDSTWKLQRNAARRKEVMFGLLAYLTWTYEGEGLLLASTLGAVGGWLILRSLLSF